MGTSLNKQPSTEEILDALDPALLHQSSLEFPITRAIHTKDVTESDKLKCSDTLYDPCFLLPLFSHLSASGKF